jgi:RND family efflux transporter MFP subunit
MTNKGICFFLVLLFLVTGCNRKRDNPGKSETEIPVVTSLVEINPTIPEISLSGNIEGYKTVRLGFMVAGKIDYIGVEEGGPVSKIRLLASLDPESYSIAKELADIQVNQFRDEYDRLKSMYDKNSLSESDFVKISSGLLQAKAQQKLHLKNLADTKLFSPIDGILLKRLAEVGEITGAGIPLFVVSDIRKVKVNAFIPENELHNIKLGQKAKVTVSSLNETFEGKIIEVGSMPTLHRERFL